MSQQVEAVRHELKTIERIAKFAMPDIIGELRKAIKALPDLEPARTFAARMTAGGSELIHYPSLRALVEAA